MQFCLRDWLKVSVRNYAELLSEVTSCHCRKGVLMIKPGRGRNPATPSGHTVEWCRPLWSDALAAVWSLPQSTPQPWHHHTHTHMHTHTHTHTNTRYLSFRDNTHWLKILLIFWPKGQFSTLGHIVKFVIKKQWHTKRYRKSLQPTSTKLTQNCFAVHHHIKARISFQKHASCQNNATLFWISYISHDAIRLNGNQTEELLRESSVFQRFRRWADSLKAVHSEGGSCSVHTMQLGASVQWDISPFMTSTVTAWNITFNRLSWSDWCVTWQMDLHTEEEEEQGTAGKCFKNSRLSRWGQIYWNINVWSHNMIHWSKF